VLEDAVTGIVYIRHEQAELTPGGEPRQFLRYPGIEDGLVLVVVVYIWQNACALTIHNLSFIARRQLLWLQTGGFVNFNGGDKIVEDCGTGFEEVEVWD
jgi:hypothetical protein